MRRDKQKGTGWRSISSPLTCLRVPHPPSPSPCNGDCDDASPCANPCLHPPSPNPIADSVAYPMGDRTHLPGYSAKLGLPAAELRARTVYGVDGNQCRQASGTGGGVGVAPCDTQRVDGAGVRRHRDGGPRPEGRTLVATGAKGGAINPQHWLGEPGDSRFANVATAVLLFCG